MMPGENWTPRAAGSDLPNERPSNQLHDNLTGPDCPHQNRGRPRSAEARLDQRRAVTPLR